MGDASRVEADGGALAAVLYASSSASAAPEAELSAEETLERDLVVRMGGNGGFGGGRSEAFVELEGLWGAPAGQGASPGARKGRTAKLSTQSLT